MLVLAVVGCGREWLPDPGVGFSASLVGPVANSSADAAVSRRAEDAARAGTAISVRRMVPVVAPARCPPAMTPAAGVKLNAITSHTNHALFAVNFPDGRCASGAFVRSA